MNATDLSTDVLLSTTGSSLPFFLGLFHRLYPLWRPRGKPTTAPSHSSRLRKPPDRYCRHCYIAPFFYLLFITVHTTTVYCEKLPLSSLGILPLTFIFHSSYTIVQQKKNQQAITQLLNPHPDNYAASDLPMNVNYFNTTGNPSNATKLIMLSAWQSTNNTSPLYMDYASGSKAICVDTGASSCISNNKTDFISLKQVTNQTITSIGSGLEIAGRGTLRWTINDDQGNPILLHV
jgi:hypothetical protein